MTATVCTWKWFGSGGFTPPSWLPLGRGVARYARQPAKPLGEAPLTNSTSFCSGRLLRRGLFLLSRYAFILVVAPLLFASVAAAQTPDWCKPLPRPEYKSLARIHNSDPWFEVYKVAPNTFAIYEPHQFEEVISYLILGQQQALLFDTGMGISDIRKLVRELTALPIVVLNSHTHNDHVGGNWQFDTIYSMDTDFTRQNAKGSTEDAQDELAPGQICGELPKNFDAKTYRTKPWTISKYVQDGDALDLGGRELQIIATPGHTPDSICLFDSAAGLLFTGDTYYPAPIWLYRPETDLALYEAAVLRLAVQLHNIKTLLGAHNIPVAPPTVLPKLADASAELQAQVLRGGKGKGHCKPAGPGQKTCKVGDFTFLLHAAP